MPASLNHTKRRADLGKRKVSGILKLGRGVQHPRGAGDPEVQGFILPLIFAKRLRDVFDDELNRIAQQVGSRAKAFKLVEKDHKLVHLPLKPGNPDDAVTCASWDPAA